jgi:hypothetical protein
MSRKGLVVSKGSVALRMATSEPLSAFVCLQERTQERPSRSSR